MEIKNYKKTLITCYIGFITQAIVANFTPLLFLRFHAEFNIPIAQIALISTVFYIVQILVDVFCAKFVDRIGYRKCVVASQITSAVGLISLAFLPSLLPIRLLGILISVVIYAVGSGLIEVLVSPIVEACPFENKDSVMSLLRTSGKMDQISSLDGMYAKERFVVATQILDASGNVIGYAFVTNVIDNILGAWTTFLGIAAIVAMGVFAAALLMSLVYSKRMARPLDEMAAASRKFARGDFSVRVKQQEDPTDEMGALIESFNKMADSLESAEARRSEFIANISHELRTPMTTIAGFADGILDGTIPKEDEEKYLISIRDETRRLSRLVRDMLDVSQMKAGAADPARRTVFDLTELILQTMLSFESRATKKNLDVDPQFPENHIMVRADKDAITQVIYNLTDNAVKFAAPGSCIIVRLYKDEGKAYVSIKDYGETIPPEDLPFIFDRFHKSDRSRSLDKDGVGLGLYLVKSIINSHDEDIAVKSEDGMTEFVFTLPLAE